ncbi:putative catabolic 3-dehydroquinase [Phaeomoniella chlamydospora]|uniref:Catabolic 3-dehydroquinase n=1 Tax=Phaeomoniella chlamydospora TaxID=158046 RepID=A0A0G2GFJ4_PHACM|nr:putative catabolic 3-dehydroquinase [Phaeomoniella chlamydospora]
MTTSPAKSILVLHGPNLNLLGTREPGIYGSATLPSITSQLDALGPKHNIRLQHFQTNHEGMLVDRIHEARTQGVDAIIINPAAFTHYSVALRDALLGVDIPFVEVHISNVYKREAWREKSFFKDKAEAVIAGLGVFGYVAALEFWSWKFNGQQGFEKEGKLFEFL